MTAKNFMERNPQLRELIGQANLSVGQVVEWHRVFEGVYTTLSAPLPSDHPWKTSMRESAERSEQTFLAVAEQLGCTPVEGAFIGLAVYSHAFGRLSEAFNRCIGMNSGALTHGDLTARAVIMALPQTEDDPLWSVTRYAMRHRPDPFAPTMIPEYERNSHLVFWDEATRSLLGLLRDCIKREGLSLRRIRPNTSDPKEKENIRVMTYALARQEEDPVLGTEQRQIVPESCLERFEQHQALIRADCYSYEALMLQIVAYLFDVAHPEFLDLIVEEGGPRMLLEYLQQQLSELAPEQLPRVRNALLAWNPDIANRICPF